MRGRPSFNKFLLFYWRIFSIKMKTITPILLCLFLSVATLAQTEKVSIFCKLTDNGKVDYGSLPGLLPLVISDGARDSLLIDPRRQYHLNNFVDALLLMNLSGWKLVSTDRDISGSAGSIYSSTSCLLTRDIYLDEKSKAMFIERLKALKP
jgi:hypothetical protein